MSKKYGMILFIFFILLMFVSSASALVVHPAKVQISVETNSGTYKFAQGSTFTVVVKLDDTQYQNAGGDLIGVAGAALTIVYDTSAFEVVAGAGEMDRQNDVNSDTFLKFNNEDYPRIGNNDPATGKLKLSGAYIDPATGDGAYTGSQKIFLIQFRVKSSAVNGDYNIYLKKTRPTQGGWDGSTDVEPLVGVVDGWESNGGGPADDFEVIPSDFVHNSTSPRVITVADDACKKGDADGSDTIDSTDALWVLYVDAGVINAGDLHCNCDVNNDTLTDSTDALWILYYDAGVITEFP